MTEQFKTLYTILNDLGKAMKIKDNDYIYLDLINRRIYVVESISIKFIDISTITELIMYDINIFNNTMYLYKYIKEIIKSDFDSMYDNIFVSSLGVLGHVDSITMYDFIIMRSKVLQKINVMNYNLSKPVNITVSNIQEDEKFQYITTLKSSDGAEPYIIDQKHIITLFNGLIPLLKSDKVDIEIRDGEHMFSIVFIVRKKKYTVNMYMNCFYI